MASYGMRCCADTRFAQHAGLLFKVYTRYRRAAALLFILPYLSRGLKNHWNFEMASKQALALLHSDNEIGGAVHRLERDGKAEISCEHNLKFMRRLPDESIDLIVTSPPYNIGKSYEKRSSLEKYVEDQAACIAEAVRLLAPNGSICWQVGNHVDSGEIFPLDILLYPLFKNHGLQLRNRIVWTFGHGLHCQKRFSGRHETILWFTKSEEYTFNLDPVRIPSKYPNKKHFKGPNKGELSSNPLGKNPADVWDIPNVKSNHVEKTDHPCQFPIGLVERLVLSLTNEGGSVLDPYLGVGSSAIAALKNGRHAYGCDLDRGYVDIAWERIHQLRAGTLRTRPMNKPIYDPNAS
jgi:adenine-specific DNA-methyltransferase